MPSNNISTVVATRKGYTGTISTGLNNNPLPTSPAAEVITCTDSEMQAAYEFAFEHNLTTMINCKSANLEDMLLRKHAAKMIVNFAINVLGKQPDLTRKCVFADMIGEDLEMQQYATAVCQLGLMGLKGDGSAAETFNPNGIIDKAQFATILSRMLWGDENNTTEACWYCKHVDALKAEGVIKVTTDLMSPLKRGRAMLMLMRLDQ